MAEIGMGELDVIAELQDFRKRIMNNEEVSDEEFKAAVLKLQTFRDTTAKPVKAAAVKKATTASKKTNKAAAMDLLGDLLGPAK